MMCWICILKTLMSGWSFLFEICICKLWSHCSQCKHDLHVCRECSAPFSPEMTMIVTDRDTNICIEWHNRYYQWKQKHQSLLLRGIGSGPGLSSPPLILLPFLTWWLGSPILVPGVKLAYHYLHVDRFKTHFHAYRPQLLCIKVFL